MYIILLRFSTGTSMIALSSLVTHALKLQASEVPNLGHLVLCQVFINGRESPSTKHSSKMCIMKHACNRFCITSQDMPESSPKRMMFRICLVGHACLGHGQ